MQVTVQKIIDVAADVKKLAALEAVCFSDAWSEESIVSTLSRRDGVGLLLECDGEAVGYVIALSLFEVAEILRIAVHPTARRKGLGAKLLGAFFDCVAEQGVNQVLLEVREGNEAAIALYENNGFIRGRLRERYYENGENAIEMQKPL